jgi:polysaccharide export outer membrane protein
LSGLFLAGCGSPSADKSSPRAPAGQAPAAISAGSFDTFRAGESLTITFADLPNPVPVWEDKIKEDGTITLMHNQTFVAANKTRAELEKEIRARYVPDWYKSFTVTVNSGQSRVYYVGGEVRSPGRQVYLGPISVTKAIQTAGDFTDFAKKTKVKLTRVDGRVQTVNCKKALGDPRLDPEVYPGDKVTVPRRIW